MTRSARVAIGLDGIVLSNHGGRQLDNSVTGFEVLPEIARAVGGRASILIDGGVRRGGDIAKALALGAEGVHLGRACAYGVAAGGRAGVAQRARDPRRRIRPDARADRLPERCRPDRRPDRREFMTAADPPRMRARGNRYAASCCAPGASRARSAAHSTNCCRASACRSRPPRSTSMPPSAGRRRASWRSATATAPRCSNWRRVRPATDFIGVEVHPPGIGHCLLGIESRGLTNLRVIAHDAVEVLATQFGAASLDAVLLYFPDPWPKKRHHKRRIVQPAFVAQVADRLKPGGAFRLATDWEPYAAWMLEVLGAEPRLVNAAPDGRFIDAGERAATRFEARGRRLGHAVFDLEYRRA